MNFINFKEAVHNKLDVLTKDNAKLFTMDINKDEIWDLYLDSFPSGTNEIYRERREYDCNCCRQFIRAVGGTVGIVDNEMVSIWDVEVEYPYNVVAKALSTYVKLKTINNPLLLEQAQVGTDKNFEEQEDGFVKTWSHFHYKFPVAYVNKSTESVASVQGTIRTNKEVFKRSLDELTLDASETILDLIAQDSLYRGLEFKNVIEKFVVVKKVYDKLPESDKELWTWNNAEKNLPVVRIRNSAIGTLLVDLSEGTDLNVAVSKFESVVAPTNYKRPKAIFTKKMVEQAEQKIMELGLENSLARRYAVTEDITVNNVLYANRESKKKMNVFDEMKEETKVNIKSLDKVEEVKIEDFIKNILPTTTKLELMVEGKHSSNLMSLIAPQDKEAPTMFKWNNNFSWTYNGDITDSMMKTRVKEFGGDVDGVLRFSIQWNDEIKNSSDLDAHCLEPSGNLISYANTSNRNTSGKLDVDIQNPNSDRRCKGGVAVENITWTDINKMGEGKYVFQVHNYSQGTGGGFTAEIEYNGEIFSFRYDKDIRNNAKVLVAEVEFTKANGLKFIKSLDSSITSKEIWGIKTQKFEKVNLMMLSPNYWDEQVTGNKHYFFMIDKCVNENTPRGFFNEFLKEDLLKEKRVFEALGSKLKVEPSDNQLSGLGFSSTQRNSVIAKVTGKFERTIKLMF